MPHSEREVVRLCQAADVVEGAPVAVDIQRLPPLVVYQVDSDYYVTDNRCTHGNGMLSEGFQDGSRIECPFHGGAFDIRSGEAVMFPCQKPVRTYPVSIVDGWIAIPAVMQED